MCQVHTGAYVSLLAPGKTDYTACHPRKTTTYILHVVYIITHIRTTDASQFVFGNKKVRTNKKRKERKEKKAKKENEEKARKERKERKGKTRRGSKERKREKNGPGLTPDSTLYMFLAEA